MELKYDHLTRQLDVIPLEAYDTPINIIGAGAIGSLVSLNLAKMGFTNQTVWDHDEVSIENMSCQFYRFGDIGKSKVLSLKSLIWDFTQARIETRECKWEPNPRMISGIVICCVDDMEARRKIFEAMETHINVNWFIDTRMGLEFALMYVMNPHDGADRVSYLKTCYSNDEAVQERCTAKSIMYTAQMVAGLAAKSVKNLVCKEKYPRIVQWDIAGNTMNSWGKQ